MFTSEVDCLTAVITNIKQRDHIPEQDGCIYTDTNVICTLGGIQ